MKIRKLTALLIIAALVLCCAACKRVPDETGVPDGDSASEKIADAGVQAAQTTQEAEEASYPAAEQKAENKEEKPQTAPVQKTDNQEEKPQTAPVQTESPDTEVPGEAESAEQPQDGPQAESGGYIGTGAYEPGGSYEYVRIQNTELPDIEGKPAAYYDSKGYSAFVPGKLEDLEADADYIVIGVTRDGIADCKNVVKDDGPRGCDFGEPDFPRSYTLRDFEIEKIYKGEPPETGITVMDRAVTVGDRLMIWPGQSVELTGDRYLLFLTKTSIDGNLGTPCLVGRYNLDNPDINEAFPLQKQVYAEVLEKYAADFAK